jgi:hypothetical protein
MAAGSEIELKMGHGTATSSEMLVKRAAMLKRAEELSRELVAKDNPERWGVLVQLWPNGDWWAQLTTFWPSKGVTYVEHLEGGEKWKW